jgi:hypothetical protein
MVLSRADWSPTSWIAAEADCKNAHVAADLYGDQASALTVPVALPDVLRGERAGRLTLLRKRESVRWARTPGGIQGRSVA